MTMTARHPDLTLQAETLMQRALSLLDQASMGLPAAHLQSALDLLRCEHLNDALLDLQPDAVAVQ